MSRSTLFAAQILETSAPAYAGYAASLLLERHPEVAERFAPRAMSHWKTHLTQRVLELAAALGAEEPRIFTSRVDWARKAFRARDMDEADLRASLACLEEVLRAELPEEARGAVAGYLGGAVESLAQAPPDAAAGLDPSTPAGRRALEYMQAVLEGDARRGIEIVVGAVDDGFSPQDACLGILLPAQREIGEMWHAGDLSIAEEHFVTATTERAMSVLSLSAPRANATGKTMVAAAVAGNVHGLAVRVVADFFEMAGWRAVCLGADVPPSDVATAAVYFDADLAVVSAALAVHLKAARQTVAALRRLEGREVKVLVGGVAFADAPDLWRRLGTDGYAAAADEAVALGGRLFGLDPASG